MNEFFFTTIDCLVIHNLIKELIIGEGCYNEFEGDLVIENYPNLQSIVVKKGSLMYVKLLKICNCENLKTIEIEDSDENQTSVFKNARTVIIESISSFYLIF